MKENFRPSLEKVLKHEGGWSNHRFDPGGATMRGVTLRTYRSYYGHKTKHDLKNISQSELEHIYKKGYWDKCNCDSLPSGIDYAVFDFGINSGPRRACKMLQKVVGVKQDGIIGPITLKAIRHYKPSIVIKALTNSRMSWLHRLSSWRFFGKGWSRRVAKVGFDAAVMVGNDGGMYYA